MEIQKKVKDFKALAMVVKRTELEGIYLKSCKTWRSLDALKQKAAADAGAAAGMGGMGMPGMM